MNESEREAFEAWAIQDHWAWRDEFGFWFHRNGGDGMYQARLAARASIAAKQSAEPALGRDADWVLAMAHALGKDSGFRVPIVPTVAAFKELFDALRTPPSPTAVEAPSLPPRELMQRALSFYETCPDGQYDIDVVVPLLLAALASPTAGEAPTPAPIYSASVRDALKNAASQIMLHFNNGNESLYNRGLRDAVAVLLRLNLESAAAGEARDATAGDSKP